MTGGFLPNLTLNYVACYEYFSPYAEKNDSGKSDHNADFTQVVPVEPGQKGPYSGSTFPARW
jgi:hypothetical protein